MNRSFPLELKWGLIIGLINLAWLYLSYYLGLHTHGILLFQLVPLGWLLITVAGFALALKAVKQANPSLSYLAGLRSGAIIALVTALIAVGMQIGYYTLIHPQWPRVMAQQTLEHFAAQKLPAAEVERMVEQARTTFSLTHYATQSALTALIGGIVLSAILMLFLRDRRPSPAKSIPGA